MTKKLTFLSFTVISAGLLAACMPVLKTKERFTPTNAQVAEAQTQTAYNMKDPSSAQFRNLRGIRGKTSKGQSMSYICGEINGKNSFGGYVGFTPFIYDLETKAARIAIRDMNGINIFDLADINSRC
ncbi:hypothetical protein IQ03_04515 [Gemmobacter caeni]|uniref:Beta-barrel assembly machine subunit BamE n=1 Tax=Gemmobacter caeni TaxID=589035 RepID=A0A2T6AP76_9RHOB|nr:hypothetical protein [Gemmobacter caeni]PTX45607.1 hypothetical protein C8N34_12137 [Gemmobacter caeni]TWI93754.1 hypothetical protein IQ03_04515 [Gemmobacter caeni]